MPAHNRKKGRKRPLPGLVPRQGMVVVGGNDLDLMFSARLQAATNPRQVQSYSSRHNILVVGDGDLTFALSLATALGGTNIVATTFDTKRELLHKYQGVNSTITSLQRVGTKVLHGIDATKLDEAEDLEVGVDLFHRIVFNFPHIGGATVEDMIANQNLLRAYFEQSSDFLHPNGGEAHVTLRPTVFYESWDVVGQARAAGFRLLCKESFETDKLLSYENQRTSGESSMRQAPSIENAIRYRFVLVAAAGKRRQQQKQLKQLKQLKQKQQQQTVGEKQTKLGKVKLVKSKTNFSLSASGSHYLKKRKLEVLSKQEKVVASIEEDDSVLPAKTRKQLGYLGGGVDVFSSRVVSESGGSSGRSIGSGGSGGSGGSSSSSKKKKKQKRKKKKSRLSLFQKKEDARIAEKE